MSTAGLFVSARAKNSITALTLVLGLGVLGAGCSKQSDTPEEHLTKGNAALEKGQLRDAEKEFREVLRLSPKDPVAQGELALIYFDQEEFRQSFPLLKQAAEAQPDNLDLQVKLVRAYVGARQFQAARDLAQQIVETHPGQDEALALLASAGAGLNDIDGTRKLLDDIRTEDKQRGGYHIAQAVLLVAQKDNAGAERELKAAIAADPKSAAAHSALAGLYWSTKNLKQAEQEYKTAAELSPKLSSVRLQLPNFLLKTGSIPEAKKILEEASKENPDYLPPRVLLMRIACSEKQDDACAARVKDILEQDPNNFDALLQDAVFKLAKGDHTTAARELQFLASNYAFNPVVRYHLARANLLQSRGADPVDSQKALDQAESNLTEAVRLAPNYAPAVLALSELKIRKGSPAAAIEYLQPLVEQNPQFAQAQYLLASAYAAQKNVAGTLAVYQRLTELFPNDPQPPFLTGLILLSQGQEPEARKALEKSIEISPDYLPATEKLIDLDIAHQQLPAAMDRIQKQIEKNPKSAQALAIRAKIFALQKDFGHAEADLSKSIELDPNLEPSYSLLAQIYVATNRQQEAIEKLSSFAKDHNDATTLLQLAAIQMSLRQFAEARDTYEKLLGFAPNFAPALNNLALIYSEQLGDVEKGYEMAKRARDAAPAEPHMEDTLGWLTFKKGDYRSALSLLSESATKLPDQPQIVYHLAMVHYMLGEEDAARTALQSISQTSADFPQKEDARERLAILSIDPQNASDEARARLETYLHQQPKDPVALSRLAELQQRGGSIDSAIEAYQKAIDADPSFGPAIRELAILYSQRPGDQSKAYDLATKARQLYPDDARLAKTLGILTFERGLYPQAVELLSQAAARGSEDAEVQFYLGSAYQEMKNWDQCRTALDHAIALQLAPKFSADAQAKLATCTDMAAQ